MNNNETMHTKIPLWLDCDPGHDDACALLLAAYHPRLDLIGVSSVNGNTTLKNTTTNALAVLEAIGRSDVPVYPGCASPLCRTIEVASDIHGESGLGGTNLLPTPQRAPSAEVTAITKMRNTLLACPPNTAWLVATGPLTNVAVLFAVYPEVAQHIRGLSIMGGAIGDGFTSVYMGPPYTDAEGRTCPKIGNRTDFAEFNIWADPEAAQSVLRIPRLQSKTAFITLDLTHQAYVGKDVQKLLLYGKQGDSDPPTRLRRMFNELFMFFSQTYTDVFGLSQGPPLHDPLAVAVLLSHDDDAARRINFDDRGGERWHLEVVLEGEQVGRTVATPANDGVTIPRSLDLGRFWEELEHCMALADAATEYRR